MRFRLLSLALAASLYSQQFITTFAGTEWVYPFGGGAALDAPLSRTAAARGARDLFCYAVHCCHQTAASISQLARRPRPRRVGLEEVLEPRRANVSSAQTKSKNEIQKIQNPKSNSNH